MVMDEAPTNNESIAPLIPQQWLELSSKSYCVNNGNIPKWEQALELLRTSNKGKLNFRSPYIFIDKVGLDNDVLFSALEKLKPWRKGPFKINKLKLESEWQGDLKWQRLIKHIQPLSGKKVLDVGSGNGYFTLRMALEGASLALGVEPFLLFNYQFNAIKSLLSSPTTAHLLATRLEEMTPTPIFDTVFSMGVLYHQRDHIGHLKQLKKMMAADSELVLETLIVEGPIGYTLTPQDRYARMRNVHCLPSIGTLTSWLKKAEFSDIKVLDTCKTTPKEQRRTKWIGENSASLEDFLDPENSDLTIEGYPAPKRVIVIAKH